VNTFKRAALQNIQVYPLTVNTVKVLCLYLCNYCCRFNNKRAALKFWAQISVGCEDKTEMQHHTVTGPQSVRAAVHSVAAVVARSELDDTGRGSEGETWEWSG